MNEPLRFGIVGCGVIGPTHADAITSLPDAQLVAVADIDRPRADAMAVKYGASAYGSLDEMISAAHPDVISICTPSGLHAAMACTAMRAGSHALVEKPMALRRVDLDEMQAAQREMGVQLAVISQHRFDESTEQVKALLDAGSFGRLALGNAAVPWWRSQAYYDSGDWRGTRELDGGVLMNQAIHSIDLLQWLMGPVSTIYAYSDTLAHEMESEDVAVAVLRFKSGALGTIAATTANYPGDITRIEVFGNEGGAVIENDKLAYLRYKGHEQDARTGGERGEINNEGGSVAPQPALRGHAFQYADLIRAIREGGNPAIGGGEGRKPVEVILAIYEAASTGREVKLS